jgi:hypothetical protein
MKNISSFGGESLRHGSWPKGDIGFKFGKIKTGDWIV